MGGEVLRDPSIARDSAVAAPWVCLKLPETLGLFDGPCFASDS